MKTQDYLQLKKKHTKAVEDFPIAYAFNKEQLKEALGKLGVEDVKECTTIFGHGDIVKKTDADRFIEMLENHTKELQDALQDKDFAVAAFQYEMDNHEYAINYDGDSDVLGCFGLEEDDLEKLGLTSAYMLARKRHMDNAREWM